VIFHESPYIRYVKNKYPPPDPDYVYDLNVLRAMIRQEDRQGDEGWGGMTWTWERYQRLKGKRPEAVLAFEAELRWEKERERLQQEALDKYEYPSPYIQELERWPESEARDQYLEDLRRLRDVMVHSKVGYIGYAGGAILGRLKNRYPQAHDVFKKELGGL
jgi:hypothetical protein